MAEFRKVFYALGFAALLAGVSTTANAQVSCSRGAGSVPTTVRAESFSDLTGDFVLDCTGGTPTTPGTVVPPVNITLTLSTNITSKILFQGTVGNSLLGGGAFTESLLIIDEPNSSPQRLARPLLACGDTGAPYNPNGVGQCQIVAPQTSIVNGSTVSPGTYDGQANGFLNNVGLGGQQTSCNGAADPDGTGAQVATPAANTYGCGRPNVFQGRQGLAQNSGNTNIMVWNGVPFDPPGNVPTGQVDNSTLGHRILRITNIRANSPQVAGGFLLAEITASINITGISGLTISEPTQRVASVQIGIQNLGLDKFETFVQCDNTARTQTVRFREGFASSFKTKGIEQMIANGTAGNVLLYNTGSSYGSGTVNQNVPGANYNTESGFVSAPSTFPASNPSPNPPPGVGINANSIGNGALNNGTGISTAGIASQGTRIALTFSNVPNGMSMSAPNVVNLYQQNSTSSITGVAVRTSFVSAHGDGPFTSLGAGSSSIANNDLVVYEILFANPSVQEDILIPVLVTPLRDLASDLPEVNKTAQVAGGFAPFILSTDDAAVWGRAALNEIPTATIGSGRLPVPRFRTQSAPIDMFRVVKCSCNLLFPFISNAGSSNGNFDTGIALANTSLTPGSLTGDKFSFSNTAQSGPVRFWFYPANGAVDPPVASKCTNTVTPDACPSPVTGPSTVAAGDTLLYILSTGSARHGLKGAPGFTGYMIAQASFQYCHAFAYISPQGATPLTNGMSVGYLALQLDNNVNAERGLPSRTLLQSESLAH